MQTMNLNLKRIVIKNGASIVLDSDSWGKIPFLIDIPAQYKSHDSFQN